MAFATLDDLRANLGKPKQAAGVSAAYAAKMLHQVPHADVVDRTVFLLQRVAGKRVLEFGASGPMHDGIVKAAATCIGVDRQEGASVIGFDLDDVSQHALPEMPSAEVIVCGEVLEHLSNPGWFLTRLKKQFVGVTVVITVPNAYSLAGRRHMERGIENVNADHCSWYSYKTMSVLIGRHGYTVKEFYFYNGEPFTAEGLIFVCE